MAKIKAAIVRTDALNVTRLAAKAARRMEKANYPIEEKLATVEKLRDVVRDIRANSRLIKRGSVIKT